VSSLVLGEPRELTRPDELRALLETSRSIAVLGIKTVAQREQPGYYVPEFAQNRGYSLHPVPVYYPEATEILGRPVHRSVRAIGAAIDVVNVFRKPSDLPAHLEDLLAARPRSVWLQLGIRHDDVARALVEAGIFVVQDRCLLVELERLDVRAAQT
jgi:predicted CoA-binding protein